MRTWRAGKKSGKSKPLQPEGEGCKNRKISRTSFIFKKTLMAKLVLHYVSGTLVDVIKNVDIPWDPDTEDISIRTVGGINSNEYMKVEFLSPLGNTAGGVNVIFTNPVLYWLSYCQSNPIPFLTTLPKETIWTIKYIHAELRVIFYCNGVEELNVDLSSDCSYGHWKRVWRTKPVRIKFNSKDTASDGYSLSFDKYGGSH